MVQMQPRLASGRSKNIDVWEQGTDDSESSLTVTLWHNQEFRVGLISVYFEPCIRQDSASYGLLWRLVPTPADALPHPPSPGAVWFRVRQLELELCKFKFG